MSLIIWVLVGYGQGDSEKYLIKHFSKPKLTNLTHIAVDEISIGKRHKYITLVLDLKSGAVVFIGDGKGADSLKPFGTS
jgi:hypothetical protein